MSAEGENKSDHIYDVVIIGGGAAGIGVAVALKHAGIENFVVLERHIVGASFALWPRETRFITPSFATNSIGMLDLNAIALETSPAFMLGVEHPTGEDYAAYLFAIVKYFDLPIRQKTDVQRISKLGEGFCVETANEAIGAKHVIWAAGEFQYPKIQAFAGSEHCLHTATVPAFEAIEGDEFIVIGGYESGVDAAYNLANRNKRVRLLDEGCPWEEDSSDPSVALSTYSLERMRSETFKQKVELFADAAVESVSHVDDVYVITTQAGQSFRSKTKPLLAGGFEGSHKRLPAELFERRDDGYPLLNENDESTVAPGLFLCGPSVRHDEHIFCFIYKFRQRFAVVAKAIANSLELPAEYLETYRVRGMYLDDLSCCGEECIC